MKGKFDAIKYARSLEKQLSAEPAKKKKLQEELAALRKRVLLAGKNGFDTEALGGAINDIQAALDKNDHAKAGELMAAAEERLREGLGRLEEATLEDLEESTRTIIGEVELLGVDVSGPQELFAQAEEKVGQDDDAARRLLVAARQQAQKARESIISDAVSFPQGLVVESEKWGMDVLAYKAVLDNVGGLIASGDWGRVIELTDSLREDIDKGRRVFFKGHLEMARADIEGRRAGGADTGRQEALLSKARSSMDRRDYETAAELLAEIGQASAPAKAAPPKTERQAQEPSEAAGILHQARAAISAGAKMGMDISDFNERYENASEMAKGRKGPDAVRAARELLDEVLGRQRDLTASVIASLEGDLRSLRKAGANVDSPESALRDARKALEQGIIEQAFSLARRALDESEALREHAVEPVPERPGAEAPGIGRALELIGMAEADGACLEGVEGLVIAAMERSENGTAQEAEEAADTLERSIQLQTRAFAQAEDALQRAQETVAEALIQELGVQGERQKLSEALSACARGEYESARYQAAMIGNSRTRSASCRSAAASCRLPATSFLAAKSRASSLSGARSSTAQ